jgi:hypothetical protein
MGKISNDLAKSQLDHHHTYWRKCMEMWLVCVQLPREIGYLVSLQSLDVSHNKQLTTLPDELGRCTRLWEVSLFFLKKIKIKNWGFV